MTPRKAAHSYAASLIERRLARRPVEGAMWYENMFLEDMSHDAPPRVKEWYEKASEKDREDLVREMVEISEILRAEIINNATSDDWELVVDHWTGEKYYRPRAKSDAQ